jgi:hypothetical protein
MTAPELSLIPSLSLEALVFARDRILQAYVDAAKGLRTARESLPIELGYRGLPRVEIATDCGGIRFDELETDPRDRERLREAIDRVLWARLFELSGAEQIMSSDARNQLQRSLSGRPNHGDPKLPELTVDNILATFHGFALKAEDTFGDCVESVFRKLSWNYRTNEPYRLGRKMILSYAVSAYDVTGETCSRVDSDSLVDLERALHVLAKRPQPTHQTGLRALQRILWGAWVDVPSSAGAPLLRLKVYRKRSAHVEILEPELVDDLNRIMAARRPFVLGDRVA